MICSVIGNLLVVPPATCLSCLHLALWLHRRFTSLSDKFTFIDIGPAVSREGGQWPVFPRVSPQEVKHLASTQHSFGRPEGNYHPHQPTSEPSVLEKWSQQ